MLADKIVVFRLVLAAILGGLIGAERELNKRPAGLRTHILVTTGSALMMVVSLENLSGDKFRIAAQVVSGIGFLGAGTIMQKDNEVDGLTTAASIWISAGIGLAVGFGYYIPGIVTVLIVLFTLTSLTLYEKSYWAKGYKLIEVRYKNMAGVLEAIGVFLRLRGIRVKGMYFFGDFDHLDGERIVKYRVKIPNKQDESNIAEIILGINGVSGVNIVKCSLDRVREESL